MVAMKTKLVTSLISLLALSGPLQADTSAPAGPALEDKRLELFILHSACNAALEANRLSQADHMQCNGVYVTLKLSFLEDVSLEQYLSARGSVRAEMNQRAFLAYRTWIETTNPYKRAQQRFASKALVEA
ncbi:MAG: hypothetical protein AAGD04_07620 [Pseudomonadota bacterium]